MLILINEPLKVLSKKLRAENHLKKIRERTIVFMANKLTISRIYEYHLQLEFIFWILRKHLLGWVYNLFYIIFNRISMLLVLKIINYENPCTDKDGRWRWKRGKLEILFILDMLVFFCCYHNIDCYYIIDITLLFCFFLKTRVISISYVSLWHFLHLYREIYCFYINTCNLKAI